jgi:hypothetical protein
MLVGAAFPRTGTTSLTQALNILGFGPAYHITEMLERGELEDWDVRGNYVTREFPENPDFKRLLRNYKSGVDVPFCLFWKQIFHSYPGSKVILTVRDPEKWFTSCANTIAKIGKFPLADGRLPLMRRVAYTCIPILRRVWDWEVKTHWGPWQFHDKAAAMQSYTNYMEDVRNSVPDSQLLEFSVKQGWEPLCKFLEVPVPDEPFPHANDTQTQLQHAATLEKIGLAISVGILFLLLALAWAGRIDIAAILITGLGLICVFGFPW